MKKLKFKATSILQSFLLLAFFAVLSAYGQSTNVNYPTPVTSDSISGKIKARDIGDSRPTIHYYVFEGNQGDIFLKIEATNLNGDIDIFYAENLRPLTKISIYADSSPAQTGREIYLRKPEKLILRVEGRTPNDDPAYYSIKFEGSFQAVAANSVEKEPETPQVKTESEGEVKVNSIGTIVEAKPTPTPRQTIARNTRNRGVKTVTTPQPVTTNKPKSTGKIVKEEPKTEEIKEPETKPEVIVNDGLSKADESKNTEENPEKVAKKEPKSTTTRKRTTSTTKKTTAKKEAPANTPKTDPAAELAKALENVRLVVEFKDGGRIERPMNDVLKFGVDKGILTIINKDGSISKYSILEVTKITVQ